MIHNVTPSTAINNTIPLVKWKQYLDPTWKLKLNHIRTFGCLAYVHLLKHERAAIEPSR